MTSTDFKARWQQAGGAERANYGLFLQDLCDLLGVGRPDPTTDDPTKDAYVLERAVTFGSSTAGGKSSTGRIDLYKRGCFVLETKQGTDTPDQQALAAKAELGLPADKRRRGHAVRGTAKWGQMMEAARQQALGYVRALPVSEARPPFVVVADVGYCIDLYSNFAGVGDNYVPFPDSQSYRLRLADLADDKVLARLQMLFTDPQQLDPSRRAAQVTRQLAGQLAALSAQLERAGHTSEIVAQFLMRCLFTMFAEDVELIPANSFSGLLEAYSATDALRELLPDALQSLWQIMDTGGFAPDLRARLRRFNGQLFHNAKALLLTADQLTLLREAAKADWAEVEPAIFGTLLERALDPKERHSLGAHYTPRRYVERLVVPVVVEPLRREWAAAQAASALRLEENKPKEARAELVAFLRRLTSVRVLDPACGSGNFLYVTLEHLKRLEGEVLAAINSYGQTGLLDLAGGTTVSPRQLLGLELNPRAAAIADVVLKIGYLQWHLRTNGASELREPLLDEYRNVENRDAVLAVDAEGNFRVAEWPAADFIVGNPPFVGASRMRDALGIEYTETLRKTYASLVPDSADFVMFWWYRAAAAVQAGVAKRFGFITTNSLRQTFNRRVMQPFLDGEQPALALTFAIPDHPWVDSSDGAAVRVAFTVAEPAKSAPTGLLLRVTSEKTVANDDSTEVSFSSEEGRIQPDLTIGADLDTAKALRANAGISGPGVKLNGAGFILPESQAAAIVNASPKAAKVVRPYLNGRDFTGNSRGALIIDFFGLSEFEALQQHPQLYQHVLEKVKPERDRSNEARVKMNWWLHGRTRDDLRLALTGLPRYIATVETAKHRVFQFLDASVLPDNMLIAIAVDDAFCLGVLSSRIHMAWAIAAGAILGVGATPRYNKTRCFDPFPFPTATEVQQAEIRKLAEQLDTHRKHQQSLHPTLTLTDLYNVVEKLRANQVLTAKEQVIHENGLAAVVLELHRHLDTVVAAAYGWPTDLPDGELLMRLVQLNQQRAAEEAAGVVRYLRPAFQSKEVDEQLTMGDGFLAATRAEKIGAVVFREWPAGLAQQMRVVREVVTSASGTLSAAAVAGSFGTSVKVKQVQPLLESLAELSLLRWDAESNGYSA
ncbi:class I SAM-dependent DNA methyltransferase [Hymenobacter siberiensis]|uniref:class I SAM-dependent DNA methyltransferase n=1 Tax=Hymenobacter siberiensis TaxID=2848396 RepID=UPI001C1E0D69|nr:DNA methyltransferase [Hymenobacter siberiensis]MBU6122612.1 class I SAM-dependent DNA methyltransferase [Hymenobacter siberiensis]